MHGFCGSSDSGYNGIRENSEFGAMPVRSSEGFLVLMAVFREVQLCLVSCGCELCSSVPSLFCVQWSVNGGREHIDCGSSQ